MSDMLGVPWCAEHAYRGYFLNWGLAHGFPALEEYPYAVACGAYAWYMAATQGSEDYVLALLIAIEVVYDERIAA